MWPSALRVANEYVIRRRISRRRWTRATRCSGRRPHAGAPNARTLRVGVATPTKTRETRTSLPCPSHSAASTQSAHSRGAAAGTRLTRFIPFACPARPPQRAKSARWGPRHASDGPSHRAARVRRVAATIAAKASAIRPGEPSEADVFGVRVQTARRTSRTRR